MGKILTLGGRSALPEAPHEIADECEHWARTSGRAARLHFVPVLMQGGRVRTGTWMLRVALKPNDARMQLFQQQQAKAPPTEDIWFHRPPTPSEVARGARPDSYIPLDIEQMGVSGVRAFLERGDTWSGRGEYTSLEEQLRKVNDANEQQRIAFKQQQKEDNRHEQREKRRFRFGIPMVRGGLKK